MKYQETQPKPLISKTTIMLFSLALGLAGGGGWGYKLGQHNATAHIQKEAIAQQMAHYNPSTAAFEWGPASAGIVLSDAMPEWTAPVPQPQHPVKKGSKK